MTSKRAQRQILSGRLGQALLCGLAVLLLALAGCKDSDAGFASISDPRISGHWTRYNRDSLVVADLGFFCRASRMPSAKMSTAVTQEDNVFRQLQNIDLIPFTVTRKITASDEPELKRSYRLLSDYGKDDPRSRFFYYEDCSLEEGVASFLFYGRAKSDYASVEPTAEEKMANGSLLADYPVDWAPADIRFRPEEIYSDPDVIDAKATALAAYLTYIAQARGQVDERVMLWENTRQSVLRAFYTNYIARENNGSTQVIAGASANVQALVNELYARVSALSFEENTLEAALQADILSRISTYSGITFDGATHRVTALGTAMDGYPSGLCLPDGAAVLRWNTATGQFEPQTKTTTMAVVNAINRYVYPAELYYFANTRIKTSDSRGKRNLYASLSDWNTMLQEYEHNNAVIDGSTQSVALIEPAQYAVACLQLQLNRLASATLTDAVGTAVTVGTESFPLTGVIVGSQRPLDFEFLPYGDSEADDRFAYDKNVKKNSTDYFCLSAAAASAGHTSTLVVQSRDDENVRFVLEFENNSDKDFVGVNGLIYRGTKFYLVGEATPPAVQDEDYKKRVFTQDYVTVVNVGVSSLAGAYHVLPDLLSPKLEIGVQLTTSWIQAASSTVPIVY